MVFMEEFFEFFRVVMSGSSMIWFTWGPVLPVSSFIPNFFIQPKPNRGLVFFVVTKMSRSFRFPSISTIAIVFPLNLILLSFTSLYSVFSGFSGVILLNSDFGIRVTGDPLSIMNLIGRLLTYAVRVKKSEPSLFI